MRLGPEPQDVSAYVTHESMLLFIYTTNQLGEHNLSMQISNVVSTRFSKKLGPTFMLPWLRSVVFVHCVVVMHTVHWVLQWIAVTMHSEMSSLMTQEESHMRNVHISHGLQRIVCMCNTRTIAFAHIPTLCWQSCRPFDTQVFGTASCHYVVLSLLLPR